MIDVAVLGAGSAGYAAAVRAARLGLEVALIDAGPVGGTCLHEGCVPTKAWLHSAAVRRAVRHADAFGVGAGDGAVDAGRVREHADSVVARLHRGVEGLVRGARVRLVHAEGRLVDAHVVEAGDERIAARTIIVATGAEPATLGLDVDGTRILTSREALRLTSLPRRAVIVGGGVVGVEFASMWCDLGVDVTLLEAADRLLPGEDPALTRVLAKELGARGVRVLTGTPMGAVAVGDDVSVELPDEALTADLLLVAVGRRPRTRSLGLEEIGVELDGGHVVVDDHLCTRVDGVMAVGDVVAGPQLAHRGYAHGMFAAELAAWRMARYDVRPQLPADRDIPRITYSSPQIASVGATLAEAGEGAREMTYHLVGNAKALIARPAGARETGLVKVVQGAGGTIVGVHAVGDDVAELITAGALHVGWAAEPADAFTIAHPHPSVGESVGEAIFALGGRPLHMRA